MDLEEALQLFKNVPANAEVYRQVRLRMRNLQDVRKARANITGDPCVSLDLSVKRLRQLHQQYPICASTASRLDVMTDEEVAEDASQARAFIWRILQYHGELFKREHEMRMFRFAIEKEVGQRSDEWTEFERLYMVLTDPVYSSAEERLEATLALVLHLNLREELRQHDIRIQKLGYGLQSAAKIDKEVVGIHEGIVNKARSLEVDHFACAVPLSEIKKRHAAIVDDNAGCCPICHNSYTDFSTFKTEDLLADYPVRIKYCGHIVGKACLEQWMDTPKIAEARYPHRTCPLCRVEIEDRETPKLPKRLLQHIKNDRRAMDTMRELEYGWGLDQSECLEAATQIMSEDIAVVELLAEIRNQEEELNEPEKFAAGEEYLEEKEYNLHREKFVWGFRGDRAWKGVRDEWMESGVRRKSD